MMKKLKIENSVSKSQKGVKETIIHINIEPKSKKSQKPQTKQTKKAQISNIRNKKRQQKGQSESKMQSSQTAKSDPETPTDSEESDSVDEEPRSMPTWPLSQNIISNQKPHTTTAASLTP